MYRPSHFSVNDEAKLQEAIRASPLAVLVSTGASRVNNAQPGDGQRLPGSVAVSGTIAASGKLSGDVKGECGYPLASHVPLVLVTGGPSDGPRGTLFGHFAAANPHGTALLASAAVTPQPVLCVFTVADAYVSPVWYPEKHSTSVGGKVVPTWNYAVVQVQGFIEPVPNGAETLAVLETLTNVMEARRLAVDPSKMAPWRVSDAPAAYIKATAAAIRAFKIHVHSVEGAWKMSQNKSKATRESIANGMSRLAVGAQAGEASVAATLRSAL